jgi:uncharacterized protein (TIGR00255 family)
VLLSMTGFGEARRQADDVAVAAELRTVNNRYFKFSLRITEGYGAIEPQVESLVREQVKRGTVNLTLKIDRLVSPEQYSLNLDVLDAYRRQLDEFHNQRQLPRPIDFAQLLALPGVVREVVVTADQSEHVWGTVQAALGEALTRLNAFRQEEGRAMAADLRANCDLIASELDKVAARAPTLVDSYRTRLHERVQSLLEEYQVTLDPADLIREVSIFAERSDISEEIVRLRSHLEQFGAIMQKEDGAGRKLEFLIQEMFREVNTIGSKSGDVDIARSVVEMKTAIERLREMIQNVE